MVVSHLANLLRQKLWKPAVYGHHQRVIAKLCPNGNFCQLAKLITVAELV